MSDASAAENYIDIDRQETRWSPPEWVTTHSGNAIEPTVDFFAEPPPEIGKLISADSSLRTNTRPWKTASRIVLTGLVAWGGYVLADTLSKNAFPINQLPIYWIVLLFTIILTPIAWFLTRFSQTCSFVGRRGIAKVKCVGSRNHLRAAEFFLFDQAAELRTLQTRMYQHGIYTGTSYQFIWTNTEGKEKFRLSGTYRGEKQLPKPKDPFHLAIMAEEAWSAFLFDKIVEALNAKQSVRFNLTGRNFVVIGDGYLDVLIAGTAPVRLTRDEIGGIQFDSGVVKIKTLDAKESWFSSTGVYKFPYDQMANSQLFLQLYARLIGK